MLLTIYIISALLTAYPSLVYLSKSGRTESWKKHGGRMGQEKWTATAWLIILTPVIPVLNTIMALKVLWIVFNTFSNKK